jgi:hypothetical protein
MWLDELWLKQILFFLKFKVNLQKGFSRMGGAFGSLLKDLRSTNEWIEP